MTQEEIFKILTENAQYFDNNNIFSMAIRSIEWLIVKFLKWLVNQCESLFSMTIGLVDFTHYSSVQDFLQEWQGLFVVLLGISLIIIGTMYIVNWEKKPTWIQLVQNGLIGFFFITSSFYILGKINTTLVQGTDAVIETYGDGEGSGSVIVRDNLFDLYYADKQYTNGLADITDKGMPHYESLTDSDIDQIDFTEIMDPDNSRLKSNSSDILKKEILFTQENIPAEDRLTDVTYDHFGITWLGNGYYRYTVQFFTALITFIAFLIIYIILSYKVVRFVWEIIMGQFLGIIYAANLTSSQKILKTLDCIKNAYLMILLSTICMKFFLLMQTYLNSVEPFKSHAIVRCLLILFSAFSLADGPNMVEKMTGYDAGLSSGFGKMYALMRGASMPLHLGSSIAHTGISFAQQHGIKNTMNNLSESLAGAAGPVQNGMDAALNSSDSSDSSGKATGDDGKGGDLNQQNTNQQENSMNQDMNSSENSMNEASMTADSTNELDQNAATPDDTQMEQSGETDSMNQNNPDSSMGQDSHNPSLESKNEPADSLMNPAMDDYVNQSLGEMDQMNPSGNMATDSKPNTTYTGEGLNPSPSVHGSENLSTDQNVPPDIPSSSKDLF